VSLVEIESELALATIDVFVTDHIADLASNEVGGVTDAAWGADGTHGAVAFADGRLVALTREGHIVASVASSFSLRCECKAWEWRSTACGSVVHVG